MATGGIGLPAVLERMTTVEARKLLDEVYQDVERILPEKEPEVPIDPDDMKGEFTQAIANFAAARFLSNSEVRAMLPGLISQVLSRSGKQTEINASEIEQRLGPAGKLFLNRLMQCQGTISARYSDRQIVESLGDSERHLLPEVEPQMTAVDMVRDHAVAANPKLFEGMRFVGVQHLFASTLGLFSALNKAGMRYEDMHILGKNYSTNAITATHLQIRGANVHHTSRSIGTQPNFARAMEDAIEDQLRAAIESLPRPPESNPKPRIICIDDGGEVIALLHERFPQHAPYFVCVEQTRRGARVVHKLEEQGKLLCPVVNVAETWAKLEWESPMIGHSVTLELGRKLDELESQGIPKRKKAVVSGYGAVGKAVAASLKARGIEVHVYDKDPARLNDLPKDYVAHRDKQEALAHAELFIGCVGEPNLVPGDHELLPNGALLVNAASANDELSPQAIQTFLSPSRSDSQRRLWTSFMGQEIFTGLMRAEAHFDRAVKLPCGKELLLIQDGYVCNMTGERDPIPPRYIQLTRALLLRAAIEALSHAGQHAVLNLSDEWQRKIVDSVEQELNRGAESLLKPNWEQHGNPALVDPQPAPPEPAALPEPDHDALVKKFLAHTQTRVLPPDDRERVHGYVLGRTQPHSREATIAMALGCEGQDLTAAMAGAHAAAAAVNSLLNLGFHPKFRPERGDQQVSQDEPSVAFASNAQQVEDAFAHYAFTFARYGLRKKMRADNNHALADFIESMCHNRQIPLASVAQSLAMQGNEQKKSVAELLRAKLVAQAI